MADRLPCCVPGCGRSTKAGRFSEWVCQKHWSAVSPHDRRLYTAAKRRTRRTMEVRWGLVAARLWRRCRDAAIEIAMGIR